MIYKEGDTSKLENYRPISLLNSLYKIFAAIVHRRVEEKLDKHLQKTPFGFRRRRGAADALQCVRRMAEHGEQTCTKTIMVALDWEKAFDKVTRNGLFTALERMNVPTKLVNVIKAMYANPTFRVEIDGVESELHRQDTGIRQACPSPPYLCLVVMTVMPHDIHRGGTQDMIRHRILGTNYGEVLYADDTICMSIDTRAINKLLASIEQEGRNYRLKLNKGKCEVIHTGAVANVHFADGAPVPRQGEIKYLGCHINQQADVTREINKRIMTCMCILQKLQMFRRHSDCPSRFKLQAMDAVIRSKLLYGLESAQLNSTHLKKLETFQLKGLRKILRCRRHSLTEPTQTKESYNLQTRPWVEKVERRNWSSSARRTF